MINAQSVEQDNISIFGSLLSIQHISTVIYELFNGVNFSDFVNGVGAWYGIENPQNLTGNQDGHPNLDVYVKQFDNYGLYLDKTKNPVMSGKIILNSHDRVEEKDGKYYNYVQPWQHHTHTPCDGVNMYSFSMEPEKHQPSGTCNFSRIDNATLKLSFDPLVKGDNKLYVFAFNYNVFRVMSGMGGLVFSN